MILTETALTQDRPQGKCGDKKPSTEGHRHCLWPPAGGRRREPELGFQHPAAPEKAAPGPRWGGWWVAGFSAAPIFGVQAMSPSARAAEGEGRNRNKAKEPRGQNRLGEEAPMCLLNFGF